MKKKKKLMIGSHRYVVIYSSILHMRYRAGIVSDEMLALPKSRYAAIGAFEAVGTLIGMYAAGKLTINPLLLLNIQNCVLLIVNFKFHVNSTSQSTWTFYTYTASDILDMATCFFEYFPRPEVLVCSNGWLLACSYWCSHGCDKVFPLRTFDSLLAA